MSELQLKQLELGPMANFAYLLWDADSLECAVVDPGWEAPMILEAVSGLSLKITKILLTHHHPDHCNGVAELLSRTEAVVCLHEKDAVGLADGERWIPVQDGTRIALGGAEILCVHTPGHTEGSQCFLAGNFLLTGDTLFIREVGRVDLPGSDPDKMYGSLRKLAELPASLTVCPGHHYGPERSATLATEREMNPYLRACLTMGPADFRKVVL